MKETANNHFRTLKRHVLEYLKQFRDVRVFGLHVFVAIALLVTWSGLGVIQRNYQLQKEISRLEQENEVQLLENATERLKNEYFNTDQYLELTARRLGRAAPGEKVLLIPEEVALKRTVAPPPEVTEPQKPIAEKPKYQKNFEAWMEFLFRRGAS